MRHQIRFGAIVATATLALTGLATASPATAVVGSPDNARAIVKTGFALNATGFGTLVSGGQVPASSDNTAYTAIGCTVRAGVTRSNYEAQVEVPGLGTISGVRTRTWTEKKGPVVSSYATHSIAEVLIAESALGSLSIEGVRSMSRAFHTGTSFKTETDTSVARIILTPAGGAPQELEIPTPGQPLEIPGLARITVGNEVSAKILDGVRATADAINIRVFPSDTLAKVAHTATKIQKGAPFGTFRGYSAGTRARGLGETVKSGRTPLSLMPCKGTNGKELTKAVARVDLGGQIIVRGVDTNQKARQAKGIGTGYELANIAKVNLGDGALVINAIVAKANVTRKGDSLVRNATGTTVGSIVVNGEATSFPDSGVIEIPGLVKIQQKIVRRIKNGISVIALRLTLLDGSGAVVDLGMAEFQVRRG
ncbi:choice-of-anchor P family protein [Nocardioides sp.]|uniref:choice-of-anchor P family protein n=1 Tax=Nocardioides sp. TaxID=35761 RepID=UPI00286C76E3|nr:choice-of-anchor P family protein [Nocardioides sp.]